MKNRSDVFSIFQGFSTKIQNQFDTSIKILLLKFYTLIILVNMSSQFQSFLS